MPLYLADNPEGDLDQYDDDGTNKTTLATGLGDVRTMAVDPDGGKIYVGDWHGAGDSDDTIETYNLDGTGQTVLITGTDVFQVHGISIDTTNSKIYWSHRVSSADTDRLISRSNLDGSTIETVIAAAATDVDTGTAVDPAGGKIYWNGDDSIRRADLDGSNAETLFDNSGDGLNRIEDVSLDIPNSEIYWTGFNDDKIQKGNFDGSGSVTDVVTSENAPARLTIDSDGGKIYWAQFVDKKIRVSDLDGSNISTLIDIDDIATFGFAWAAAAANGARKTHWGPWYWLSGPGRSFGQSLPK